MLKHRYLGMLHKNLQAVRYLHQGLIAVLEVYSLQKSNKAYSGISLKSLKRSLKRLQKVKRRKLLKRRRK